MQFYRFRSMERLLKCQELEKREIYFASPEQLNDPMEGLQDIFWRGDRIVWKQFFKHYAFCVTCLRHRLDGPPNNFPIRERWDELPSLEQRYFDNVWRRFLNQPQIPEFIEGLANTSRKIRYEELRQYLSIIDSILSGRRFEGAPPPDGLLASSIPARENIEEEIADVLLEMEKGWFRGTEITAQLKSRMLTGMVGRNIRLFFDYPGAYLKGFEKMILPNWYTACFMKDYRNASVWAHYGDKHRGACLIFESVKAGGSNSLNLSRGTGEDTETIHFSEIKYEGKSGEIDFFRSISTLPDYIRDLFLTDGNGNVSESFPSDIDDWRQKYFDRFFHDTNIKTKDWAYEKEWRLTLPDVDGHLGEKNKRKLSYNFNSLKGIIFGMRASDEDISRVVEIIQEQPETPHGRDDFKFYQAEYSQNTGDIRKYEIRFL